MAKLTSPPGARIGIDENGLGPRLGPLIVTAALAQVDEKGAQQLARPLPPSLALDLNDSKVLVSCKNVSLGEAWARTLVERTLGKKPKTPAQLLNLLLLEKEKSLKKDCPSSTINQCWFTQEEKFEASSEELSRVSTHLDTLSKLGIEISSVRTDITCTSRLNQLKEQGIHRFSADLHSMERLILKLHRLADSQVVATCGKVGGIGKYERFFGPLSGRLHVVLEEGRAQSCYQFPQLGEIRFVRDADAADPLVMLASLVGKYVRELTMNRIGAFYREKMQDPTLRFSGYHDPVTNAFVEKSRALRKRLHIVQDCFERRPADKSTPRKKASKS